MPAADTLASIAAELSAMPARARNQIMSRLSSAERRAVVRLIHPDAALAAVGMPAPEEQDDEASLSPWLGEVVATARTQRSTGAMTAAARAVLLKSVDVSVVPTSRPVGSKMANDTSGRSLMDAFGGMLSARRVR